MKKFSAQIISKNKMKIIGKIDRTSGKKSIYGYALDKDKPFEQIKIQVVIDGDNGDTIVAKCDRFKIHLNESLENPNHGFKINIPQKYQDGRNHSIFIKSINNDIIDSATLKFHKNESNIDSEEVKELFSKDQKESISKTVVHDIAVIIPFYNSSSTAKKCLDSIISAKTNIDIQIICVDDGSTDNTLEILNDYQKKDSRIVVVTQSNQYAGIARNNGISKCNAIYVTFIDSDDKLYSINSLEKAYFYAKNNDLDVLCCGAVEINEEGKFIRRLDYVLREDFCKDITCKEHFKLEELKDNAFMTFSGVPWGKLYRKSLIDKFNIKFLDLARSEDFYFVQIALMRAEKISYIRDILVQHRIGLSTNLESNKDKTPLIFWEADKEFHKYVNSYKELQKYVLPMHVSTMNRFFYNSVSVKQFSSFQLVISSANEYLKNELEKLNFTNVTSSSKYIINKFNSITTSDNAINLIFSKFSRLSFADKVEFLIDKPTSSTDCSSNNSGKPFSNLEAKKNLTNVNEDLKVLKKAKFDAQPDVSVIIPVFNVQDYLKQCLDSVLSQKGISIEVICVDDGSTDNSLSILKEYANKFNCITVLSQKNLMAGIARNNGFKYATGKYVHFLDSDDWVNDNAYSSILSQINDDSVDLILCPYTTFNQQTKEVKKDYYFSKLSSNMFNKIMRFEYNSKLLLNAPVVPWNKIIKRELITTNNLQFDSLKCVNDRSFNFKLLPVAKKIFISSSSIVNYRIGNSKSLIGVRYNNFDCHFRSFDEVKNNYANKQIRTELIEVFIHDLVHWIEIFSVNKDFNHQYIEKSIGNYIKDNKDYFDVKNHNYSKKVNDFICQYI